MQIGIPAETDPGELRCAMSPEAAAKLVKKGAEVLVERGLGARCQWSDDDFAKSGAKLVDRDAALAADFVFRVRKPPQDEVQKHKAGALHASFLDPFNERELVEAMREHGTSALSVEMVPRSTRAQKLDALSSQHSLAGYYMVVLAAERLGKILPMMMTPVRARFSPRASS